MNSTQSLAGSRIALPVRGQTARSRTSLKVQAKTRIDPKQVLVQNLDEGAIKNNLIGVSKEMEKKGWLDASGRSGKGLGVYQFAKKYGVNVDGYSPIYTPDIWSQTGDNYKLGRTGLIAWAGLVVVLLAVGVVLIYSTS